MILARNAEYNKSLDSLSSAPAMQGGLPNLSPPPSTSKLRSIQILANTNEGKSIKVTRNLFKISSKIIGPTKYLKKKKITNLFSHANRFCDPRNRARRKVLQLSNFILFYRRGRHGACIWLCCIKRHSIASMRTNYVSQNTRTTKEQNQT